VKLDSPRGRWSHCLQHLVVNMMAGGKADPLCTDHLHALRFDPASAPLSRSRPGSCRTLGGLTWHKQRYYY
jgi:hypothetical protein